MENLKRLTEKYYRTGKTVGLTGTEVTGKWNYEDACLMQASIQLYQATGEECYRKYVLDYLDCFVKEDGQIKNYFMEQYNLDNIAGGRALLFAYFETGNEKYRAAADALAEQLRYQPRTKEGNFWHKKIYPNQVWLDGIYMAQPFYAAYAQLTKREEIYDDILHQLVTVRKRMYNEEKKLYYHGYDETKEAFWSNAETGCSKNFWSRSVGWYMIALTDTAEIVRDCTSEKARVLWKELQSLLNELAYGITRYRSAEDGLICQLIAYPDLAGNYSETSASAMVAESILKAYRINMIEDKDLVKEAVEMLEVLSDRKIINPQSECTLIDTVKVSGLGPADNLRRDGTIEYYLSEPKKDDCTVGIAAMMMAYAEWVQLYTKMDENKYMEKEHD